MLKVVLTGPESTGKSTLARQLAAHYGTAWVAEYARYYLGRLKRPYIEDDLLAIAREQLQWEEAEARHAQGLLICDTAMLVMKVWSEYKFGSCHPWILQQWQERKYDLYLLCGIDLPWTYDPLRENPDEREKLYAIYKSELQQLNANFVEIAGNPLRRTEKAIAIIDKFLGK